MKTIELSSAAGWLRFGTEFFCALFPGRGDVLCRGSDRFRPDTTGNREDRSNVESASEKYVLPPSAPVTDSPSFFVSGETIRDGTRWKTCSIRPVPVLGALQRLDLFVLGRNKLKKE